MKELTLEIIKSYINKHNDNNIIIHCDNGYKINNMFKIFKSNIISCYQIPSTECLNKQEIYFYIRSINNDIIYEYNNLKCLKEKYSSQVIKYDDLFKEKENNMNIENGYIEFNGNRAELTKEQMKVLFGKDNPYEYKENEEFYCSSSKFVITCENFSGEYNKNWYKTGNYCRDKELKIQDTLHDLLRSKLRQFSMLNGGLDIKDYRYTIVEAPYDGYTVYVHNYNPYVKSNEIYFINEKTAHRAINEVIIPFEKEYPDFVW